MDDKRRGEIALMFFTKMCAAEAENEKPEEIAREIEEVAPEIGNNLGLTTSEVTEFLHSFVPKGKRGMLPFKLPTGMHGQPFLED